MGGEEEGRVALVTGSSKGIGRFLAERLLDQNCEVWGCSRGKGAIANENYRHWELDVANEPDVIRFVKTISRSAGKIDYLINNAGAAAMNHFLLTPGSVLDRLVSVNYKGTFLLSREAAKLMQKRKFGRIVNFSTVAVGHDLEGEAVYASSKAAVESLTRVLSREVGESGITVNAVAPCPIKTDLIAGVPEDKIDRLVRRQAVKRYGTFEDIWNVVRFFLLEESEMISGQIMVLGGPT